MTTLCEGLRRPHQWCVLLAATAVACTASPLEDAETRHYAARLRKTARVPAWAGSAARVGAGLDGPQLAGVFRAAGAARPAS